MLDPGGGPLQVCLLADVFPPRSGGSGWSAFYLGRALAERGHTVRVLRPVYGSGTARPTIRRLVFRGLPVEELMLPDPPAWAKKLGLDKAWRERDAGRLMALRARQMALREGVEVLHGQHSVSSPAASLAASYARKRGAGVVSLATVRDYWPLCPVSTRLFTGRDGEPFECRNCRRFLDYVRCASAQTGAHAVRMPLLAARWLSTLLAARRLARCDAVIAVSRYVERELADSGRVPKSKLYCIPNLLDLASVDRDMGAWPLNGISAESRYLLFVGKLDINKGAWMLPEALARSGVRLPVVIAGDGPLRERIEREAADRGLDFRFYDWIDNNAVPALMHKAVALLFPSAWQEPLSRVLLEACAAGAAIVALDTGGTGDIIRHGESGLLVESRADFAGGIRQAATDPGLNARLRRGARAAAERKFASANVSAQVESLYRRLLATMGGER